ncbi:cystine transporter permease [Clostridium polyendosporum]|uniref:Cystine transporter permease n=1 Tax=Clostridium polyendosporum TaxID=69208 RepID=A0A919VEM7_9CLOT|nr:amino acid ABC transporter permease [Clostridium polyendosporum]GIM27585.1 cystine transporter permease [Clostridium polyendosporum]
MEVVNSMFQEIIEFFVTVIRYTPKFIPGVIMTLKLSVLSILIGTIFGLIGTLLKFSQRKILMKIIDAYITVVRGTPLLLQLIFIFYGLPQIGITFSAFVSAALGLAFHSGAYIIEIFRGAVESIDNGQREASRALGMTKWQSMRRVILPQAFKRSIPALGNQFIIAIKDSSLASVITMTELLMLSKQFVAATYNVFPIFFIAGCYYLIITAVLSKALQLLEYKLKVNEREMKDVKSEKIVQVLWRVRSTKGN